MDFGFRMGKADQARWRRIPPCVKIIRSEARSWLQDLMALNPILMLFTDQYRVCMVCTLVVQRGNWKHDEIPRLQLTSRHVATWDREGHIKVYSHVFDQCRICKNCFFKFQIFKKDSCKWRQSAPDQFRVKHPVDSASYSGLGVTAWDGLVLRGEWFQHKYLLRKKQFPCELCINVFNRLVLCYNDLYILQISIEKHTNVAALFRKVTLFLSLYRVQSLPVAQCKSRAGSAGDPDQWERSIASSSQWEPAK